MRPMFADRRLRPRFLIDRRPNDTLTSGRRYRHCGDRNRYRPIRLRIGHQGRAVHLASRRPPNRRPRPAKPHRRRRRRPRVRTRRSSTTSRRTASPKPRCTGAIPARRRSTCRSRPGGQDAGNRTPEWAYGAILSSDPAMAQDPPTIIALVSRLTGNVDPAKILEFAPGEIKNLPGYEGAERGQPEHPRRVRRDPDRRHLHQGRRQACHRPEDRGDPGPGRAVCAAAQRRWHRGSDGRVDGRDERHRRADHDNAVVQRSGRVCVAVTGSVCRRAN